MKEGYGWKIKGRNFGVFFKSVNYLVWLKNVC